MALQTSARMGARVTAHLEHLSYLSSAKIPSWPSSPHSAPFFLDLWGFFEERPQAKLDTAIQNHPWAGLSVPSWRDALDVDPGKPASGRIRKAAFLSPHGLSPSAGPVRICPPWVCWLLRLPSSSHYLLWGTVKYVAGMPSAKRYCPPRSRPSRGLRPSTPDGPTLSHPALHVQAAQHRAPPGSAAHRRGCRAALGAREEPRRGVAAGGGRWAVRSRGGGAKRPFEFPIRPINFDANCDKWTKSSLDVEGFLASARHTLRTVYAYLERHRDHIDYVTYKDLSLPIGSGMVESACKWLIQPRFKGVGMRWSEDGFNHLLHLRLAWVNGRFEALFGLALSPNL